LQAHFCRVETFVFSTRLARITDQLEEGSYGRALERLSQGGQGWSGGTRIGESLATLREGWPRLLGHRTVAVVPRGGWVAGSPDYQPLTRGMQAALPHVDVFAPAHNLASLEALVDHLML